MTDHRRTALITRSKDLYLIRDQDLSPRDYSIIRVKGSYREACGTEHINRCRDCVGSQDRCPRLRNEFP
jgi:hypothetical protein